MKRISGLRLALVIAVILGFMPSTGLGAWLPSFRRPIVCKDYIVFGALYGTNLICIDSSGKKIWDKDILHIREGKSWSAFPYAKKDDNSIVVQADRRVIAIDIPSGKETPLFKTHSKDRIVRFDRDSGLVWSFDYWTYRRFRMLDPESGAVLWKNRDIRHVIHASEDTLICLTGKGSFHSSIRLRAVEAFDSKSGKELWKTRLPKDISNTDLHEVFVQQHIVISGDGKLICMRAKDGEIVSMLEKSKDYRSGYFDDVCAKDGTLMYVRNYVTFEESPTIYRTFLHFCSVPDLTEESVTELSGANETVSKVTSYDRYLIAAVPHGGGSRGPARTACFDVKTGQEIWKKNYRTRSEPVNGKIYFSDFADTEPLTARIGVIDVATGKETILYEELHPNVKRIKQSPDGKQIDLLATKPVSVGAPKIIAFLGHADYSVRDYARIVLVAEYGQRASAYYAQALDSENSKMAAQVMVVIWETKCTELIPNVRAAIQKSSSSAVQTMGLSTLKYLGDMEGIGEIAKTHPSKKVRKRASELLDQE